MRGFQSTLLGGVLCLGVLAGGHHAFASVDAAEEATGTVRGTVTLDTTGDPIHGAEVWILSLGKSVVADVNGRFEFDNVPVGEQAIFALRQHLTAQRQTIQVTEGQVTEVQIIMSLTPIHESVTVTASAGETTTYESFNAVTSLDALDLAEKMAGNIGEVLENEPGVYKRSFGPGSSRPTIRGFDGDRVLIMEDGVRTGDLSSQSGDHGVTIDPAGLERLEVVRGPATLLYGSNAIGGVVNAITPHDTFFSTKHVGTDGQVLTDFGSANAQAGVNGSVQHQGETWSLWAGGGARRTSDYDSPEGTVENSKTRLTNGRLGLGYSKDKVYFSAGYQNEGGRYGIPGAGELEGDENLQIDIDTSRQNTRFDFGLRNLEGSFADSFRVVFKYIDYHHDEIEVLGGDSEVGTSLYNKTYVLRAELHQKSTGPWSGRFGFWSQYRDFKSIGEESLAPPTTQKAFAGFVYEEREINPSTRLQLGGRLEYNDYSPQIGFGGADSAPGGESHEEEEPESPEPRPRSFTGLSGSLGLRRDLGTSIALVANLSGSSRAPALEELYNFGPHPGNLAFEIGNPDLKKETSLGLDAGLRANSRRIEGGVSFYYYGISNFVFPSFTDLVVDGLRVAPYLQGNSRFLGIDGEGSFHLHERVVLKLDLSYVDARLTETDEPLPRIPPLHGRVAVEVPLGGLVVKPELVWASRQDRVFREETPTDGYTVFNIDASYLWPRRDLAHSFSVRAYNLTNELYRQHTSFVKEFTPEIGRGIKFTYSLRFF